MSKLEKSGFGDIFQGLKGTGEPENTEKDVDLVDFPEPVIVPKKADPEEIVEKTFMSMLGDYYGTRYDFNLNHIFYVAYFDGETPTRLPRSVMDYLERKLNRMDKSRKLLSESELMERLL